MCVICAKPAGVDMPSEGDIMNMWLTNRDGAGFMYPENGKVHIEKGFMKYDEFVARLDEFGKTHDLKATPLVMHFRITTHGGTSAENCHPFPITDSIGMLKKLNCTTKVGIAHNGIISITPRKGISDTMEYIASQLAPLHRAIPKFYKDKNLMLMISNAIDSKMAFLVPNGNIYTIGDFENVDGVLYSNLYWTYGKRFRDLSYGYTDYGWGDDDDVYDYRSALKSEYDVDADGEFDCKYLMWLDESKGEFAIDEDGSPIDDDAIAIDQNNQPYLYDYNEDIWYEAPFVRCYDVNYMALKFNWESEMVSREVVAS